MKKLLLVLALVGLMALSFANVQSLEGITTNKTDYTEFTRGSFMEKEDSFSYFYNGSSEFQISSEIFGLNVAAGYGDGVYMGLGLADMAFKPWLYVDFENDSLDYSYTKYDVYDTINEEITTENTPEKNQFSYNLTSYMGSTFDINENIKIPVQLMVEYFAYNTFSKTVEKDVVSDPYLYQLNYSENDSKDFKYSIATKPSFKLNNDYIRTHVSYSRNSYNYSFKIFNTNWDEANSIENVEYQNINYYSTFNNERAENTVDLAVAYDRTLDKGNILTGLNFKYYTKKDTGSYTNNATTVSGSNPTWNYIDKNTNRWTIGMDFYAEYEVIENLTPFVSFDYTIIGKRTVVNTKPDQHYVAVQEGTVFLSSPISKDATDTTKIENYEDITTSINKYSSLFHNFMIGMKWNVNENLMINTEVNSGFLGQVLRLERLPWLLTGDSWGNPTPVAEVYVNYSF